MQQRTTDKKNDIIKKFKTRAFFKTWEKGESLFTKQKTKDNITFFKKSDSLSILAEGVITEKEEQFYPSLYYSLNQTLLKFLTVHVITIKKDHVNMLSVLF